MNILEVHEYLLKKEYLFSDIISSLTFSPVKAYIKEDIIIEQYDYVIKSDSTCKEFNSFIIYNKNGFIHYSGEASLKLIEKYENESLNKLFLFKLKWKKLLTSILGIINPKRKKQIILSQNSNLEV